MKLTHIAKTLVLASTLTGAGMAQAASYTVVFDNPNACSAQALSSGGCGTLNFSEDLMGALQVAAIETRPVLPATLTDDGMSLIASAPVTSLHGDVDAAGALTVKSVRTAGGAALLAPRKNFATTGGALNLTGITVDLTTRAIYANLSGGNGVGNLNQVHVWNYANIEGPVTFPNSASFSSTNTLTGLTITQPAFNLFAQALGLRSGGIAAMRSIQDYGTMTAVIAVPEPSAIVMTGLGAIGMLLGARRMRRSRQLETCAHA